MERVWIAECSPAFDARDVRFEAAPPPMPPPPSPPPPAPPAASMCSICFEASDEHGEIELVAFGCRCVARFHHRCMWIWYKKTMSSELSQLGLCAAWRWQDKVVACPSGLGVFSIQERVNFYTRYHHISSHIMSLS